MDEKLLFDIYSKHENRQFDEWWEWYDIRDVMLCAMITDDTDGKTFIRALSALCQNK